MITQYYVFSRRLFAALLGLFGLLWIGSIQAQTVPTALADVLSTRLEEQRNLLNVKGLSAAILFPDSSVWADAKGINSPNEALTPNHLLSIGSVTKTLTAACIFQLADEQVLTLDDSLHQWLEPMPEINPNITIRQLLSHRSGIYDILSNASFQPTMFANNDSIWDVKTAILEFIQPADFAAGTSWAYSNTNYMLLGLIIQQATGQPFYTAIRNRFIDPLGLPTLATAPFEDLSVPVADVWLDLDNNGTTDNAGDLISNWNSFNSIAAAAGGYYSTATDLAYWIKAYLAGGYISDSMLQEAKTTAFVSLPYGTKSGLGLLERKFFGQTGFGHGGDLGYCANAWYFPAKDVAIVVLNNDASKNSWQVGTVVNSLMQTYLNYLNTSSAPAEWQREFGIRAYPSLFSTHISVQATDWVAQGTTKITLSNALGQTMLSQEVPDLGAGALIQVPATLAKGVYMMQVWQEGRLLKTLRLMHE